MSFWLGAMCFFLLIISLTGIGDFIDEVVRRMKLDNDRKTLENQELKQKSEPKKEDPST